MNRQWLLHERPVGMIGPEHFKYVETDIPEPGEGEVLIRNLMFSFDPTQRGWTMDRESYLPPVQIGEAMRAGCVAQVVKSNHPDFSVGQMVQATNGWQDYAVVDPAHPPSSVRLNARDCHRMCSAMQTCSTTATGAQTRAHGAQGP